MKKDVVELKKIVLELLTHSADAGQLLKDNHTLFKDVPATAQAAPPGDAHMLNLRPSPAADDEPIEVQDISHEAEDETLSIEEKEKELIIRALKKNNHRRKYAARDLGISERTLYRKIKQYHLENL
jgi:transcriptional regulator of acetoin/glycerol metabolism